MEAYSILILLLCSVSALSLFLIFNHIRSYRRMANLQKQLIEKENIIDDLTSKSNELTLKNTEYQTQLKQSFEDPVTQLLSWTIFEDRLKQALHESSRFQLTMGILYVDIDDFKVINEALGYQVGDRLLKEVGKRLEVCIRQVDSITRANKDTFVVLLTQLGKPETAAIVAQRMLQIFKEPILIKNNELFITCGIGISIYPTDGTDAVTLLRNADDALQTAKQKGKNVYQFYQENLHVESQRELAMHTSLSRETIFQEIALYFQPIYDTKTNSMMCMETLVHWQHPQLGLIPPEELFAYTEKQRKSNLISEWLLRKACQQYMEWQKAGFAPKFLAIPLSIRQLENIHFIYRISQILQDNAFDPANLLLEIKESAAQLPQEILEKAFNMLQYLGIKIAIENFGWEAFSLARLQKIHVTYLKISKEIIKEIPSNEKTLKFLKAINVFAEELSLKLIADGVNTEEQAKALTEIGFTYMQGHYFQDPMPARDIAKAVFA